MKADEFARAADVFQRSTQKVNPENIYFSVAKLEGTETIRELSGNIPRADAVAGSKPFAWGLLSSGDCACANARLEIYSNGYFFFSCSLTSSDLGDDSWGILHFDFYQNNGALLWTSGSFWSPTINSVGQPHSFGSSFPRFMFNDIAGVWMTYHC